MDDFKVTNQPKRATVVLKTKISEWMNKNHKQNLDILTAYISTFHSLKCDGSGHFTTWSNQTMKSGAV